MRIKLNTSVQEKRLKQGGIYIKYTIKGSVVDRREFDVVADSKDEAIEFAQKLYGENFVISSVIASPYIITKRDKLSAFDAICKIFEAENFEVYFDDEFREFRLQNQLDPNDYSHYETLYELFDTNRAPIEMLVDSLEARLGCESVSNDDFDRMAVIIINNSDFFEEILKKLDIEWYINEGTKRESDSSFSHLVNKTLACKMLETISAYKWAELEENGKYRIFLSNYDTSFVDNFEFAKMIKEATEKQRVFWATEFSDYGELLKEQFAQIKEDLCDIGYEDMYFDLCEFEYLTALGFKMPNRYCVYGTSDAFEYPYILFDNQRGEYAEQNNGEYYLFEVESEAEDVAEKLSKEKGWSHV